MTLGFIIIYMFEDVLCIDNILKVTTVALAFGIKPYCFFKKKKSGEPKTISFFHHVGATLSTSITALKHSPSFGMINELK